MVCQVVWWVGFLKRFICCVCVSARLCGFRALTVFGLVVDLGPGSVGVDGDGFGGVGVGEHVNDVLGGVGLFVHCVLLSLSWWWFQFSGLVGVCQVFGRIFLLLIF